MATRSSYGFDRSEKYRLVTVQFQALRDRSIAIRHEGETHFIGLTLLSNESVNEVESFAAGDMAEIEVMAWLCDKLGLR